MIWTTLVHLLPGTLLHCNLERAGVSTQIGVLFLPAVSIPETILLVRRAFECQSPSPLQLQLQFKV